MSTNVLILPGYGNSGPEHWQSLWQQAEPDWQRVEQHDWEQPQRADWCAALETAVVACGAGSVLVAHSLGCLLVAHWAQVTRLRVRGALLVAVPDPTLPAFPPQAQGFTPLPRQVLPFPSLLVASRDDPYASLDYARQCAAAWGSEYVDIGAAGHINASSGFGDWPQGRALLRRLLAVSAGLRD